MTDGITVVVPTYNAGEIFVSFCKALHEQAADITRVLIIDSSSSDDTVAIAQSFGFDVKVIAKSEFGHGKTRQRAVSLASTEFICFMTQDALLANKNAIKTLVDFLKSDTKLGAVYGRQLPYPYTGPLGKFARIYNYGEKSFINTFADRGKKGFKTAFLSDTFAAYKKSILLEIGGFPEYCNFGEDSYAAAKMLQAGYATGYCAEAKVYHAHDYDLLQEWQRSKGVHDFHRQEAWMLKVFGKPESEGLRFVVNEAKWLIANGYGWMVPVAFVHNVVKYLGYKLG